MIKKIVYSPRFIGVGCVLLFTVSIWGFYLEFNVRDHYFSIGDHIGFIFFSFWVCIALILMALIINLTIGKKGGDKSRFNVVFFLFTCIFLIITIVVKLNYYSQRIQEIRYAGYVYEISSRELQSLLDEQKSGTVYIERENCPWCQDAYSSVYKYASTNHQELMLYNTAREGDAPDYSELQDKLLERLGVEQVPTILIIEKGEVVDRLFYEEIVQA